MRNKIKIALHLIIFAVLLGTVLLNVSNVLGRKYSKQKHGNYIENPEDYDVIFLGTSHVINGINPMEIYKEYGVASYNLANHACPMALTYWVFKNSLEVNTPKLVVVDLYALNWENKLDKNIDYAHDALDAFSLNLTKWQCAWDLFDNLDDRMQMVFPFAKYHGRWNEIKKEDFYIAKNIAAGWQFRMGINTEIKKPELPDEGALPEKKTLSMEYLERLVTECKERDIDVLLCYIPCAEKTENQVYGNYGYVLAEEYGLNYFNLAKVDSLVDYGIDFFDEAGHLNTSGAKKVSSALGDFIISNYPVTDCRTTDKAKSWDDSYEIYFKSYVANMQARNSADDYLMMLNNVNLEADIYLNCDVTREDVPLLFKLIDNLNGDVLKKVDENWESEDADIRIVVRRKDTGELVGEKSFSFS